MLPDPAFSAASSSGDSPEARRARARATLDDVELLRAKGDYGGAAERAELALRELEADPASDRLSLARGLGLLGSLCWIRGDFERAESLLLRARAIYEQGLVTSHPDVANALNELAMLYQARGLYGQAEPLHRRALAIQEAVLGKDHLEVAASLNNLAILYKAQGLYEQAAEMHRRALLIRQTALGSGHKDVAYSMTNLAAVYRAQGKYAQAESLVQRALRIQQAALGPDHPDLAPSLIDLAQLAAAQGHFDEAVPLVQQALRIQEKALGTKHPAYAASLSALATLSREQGELPQAEQLARQALRIQQKALGDYHPDVAASLTELGVVRVAEGKLDDAVPLLTRAFTLSEERLRREALDFSQSRLAGFLAYLRSEEERLYALARAHPDHAGAVRLALTAALLWKGRSVQETANTSRTVYRSLGPEDRATFAQLCELRSQLARLSIEGPGTPPRADYQAQVQALVEQGDALEARLAQRSARLRALIALPDTGSIVARVAASLPGDGALVELVAYADRPVSGPPGAPGGLRYLAMVLLPDARSLAADLGPAGPIDAAAAKLRDALAENAAQYLPLAQALEALVLQPLRPLIGDHRNVFLSPDGQLALVPFAVLHDGRGYAGDRYHFTYLTSGKDLLPRPLEVAPSTSVVVFANPDFGAPPGLPVASADDRVFAQLQGRYTLAAADRGASGPFRLDAPGGRWLESLPGTGREADAIQRLFPRAQVFTGQQATKERLLGVTAPGILHLATHGFFVEDAAAAPGDRGVAPVGPAGGPPIPGATPDPLLRSGLVLAGARGASGGPAEDHALVTALELAGLDLWGTQLVVLSACDTGRGDVRYGQGVYGLRRALVVAGAETVVMSLWKVNDDSTETLMQAYYRNLLAGKGRTAALREAMQALRQKKPHPHYWAPFISLGRDAPLQLGEAR